MDENRQPVEDAVVTWQSGDETVATVNDQGLVTAVGNGMAEVTARSGSAEASVPVSVMQSATSLSIEPSSATLMSIGATIQLSATVMDENGQPVPDAAVTWQSGDEAVATVDANGLVTAVGNGTTRITATSGQASDTVEVIVEEPAPASTDRDVLRELYFSTGGSNWKEATNWLSDAPLEEWHGVETTADGRVISLELTSNGLRGLLPESIGQLDSLQFLFLDKNALTGGIPPELGELESLANAELRTFGFIHLDGNQLTGEIPPELGNLENLTILRLNDNRLTGEIPVELIHTKLKSLNLGGNELTGNIPPELGRLRLSWLSLGDNQLTGSIPPELGAMIQLDHLDLGGNELTGGLPPVLGRLDLLEVLDLGSNQLSGGIPAEYGELGELTRLDLSNNADLTGSLPLEFISLESLKDLNLENTRVCVPAVLERWLRGIDAARAALCEMQPSDRETLTALFHATKGAFWSTNTNWLNSGSLDLWHGVTTDNDGRVVELNLENNNLTGEIPDPLGSLSALTTLNLRGNASLVGSLPLAMADLPLERVWLEDTNLCIPANAGFEAWLMDVLQGDRVLSCDQAVEMDRLALIALYNATNGPNWNRQHNWLSDAPLADWAGVTTDENGRVCCLLYLAANKMSGSIPPEIGNLTRLKRLNLDDNRLTGPIPSELGRMASLKQLWLQFNQLTGRIPPELSQLSYMESMVLTDNKLTGGIPPELGRLPDLRQLELGHNPLGGTIPPELGQLKNLVSLVLLDNELSGSIPPELGQLANLEQLFLNGNSLTGTIPSELADLTKLRHMILGGNRLRGELADFGFDRMAGLEVLHLPVNRFSGPIPASLAKLTRLTALWLNVNQLSGEIPPELGQLTRLGELLLNHNRLTGRIPAELGQLTRVKGLWLQNNQLSGGLPGALGNLSSLKELRVDSNTGLTGPIPLSLSQLDTDVVLFLGDTQLCVPSDPNFQTWYRSLSHNPGIPACGSPTP